ncbi:hypothetical protein EV361DRAFT_955429 [Lentinula raphanica]|nr:hypothetical protein EV361DRAFT_955429 [Lentinula raphanica]
MSRRILRSRRRALSDPAVPGALSHSEENMGSSPRPESPLTPIESEGPSVIPSLDEQGIESGLPEPGSAALNEPASDPVEPPQSGGVAGGRTSAGNNAPEKILDNTPVNHGDHVNEKILSPEQELTVKMAEAALSDRQREEFARRQNSVRIMNEDEESRGEGPSSGKGKGVDP